MNIYIFGNGNISFEDFKTHYEPFITHYANDPKVSFSVCDFKGTDILAMELLKTLSENVFVYHIAEKPRYLPDKFKTKVNDWALLGGFQNDKERDLEAIKNCTHFIAVDFNTNKKRKSGTLKNIETCEVLGKIRLE